MHKGQEWLHVWTDSKIIMPKLKEIGQNSELSQSREMTRLKPFMNQMKIEVYII